MIPLHLTRDERDHAIDRFRPVVRHLKGVAAANERFFAACAWIGNCMQPTTLEDIMNPQVMRMMDARLQELGERPTADRLCTSMLLHEHFATCDSECRRPEHTLHEEPIVVEALTGYGEELLQYRSYHTIHCLKGRHFRLGRVPTLRRTDRLCVVAGVEHGRLVISYRPERPDGFRGLARLLAPVDEWSRAVGLDGHVGPPVAHAEDATLVPTPVAWPDLVLGPDPATTSAATHSHRMMREPLPAHSVLHTVASVCTLTLHDHQLYTILWMDMHVRVPLWRFVGFRPRGHDRDVIYGGASVPHDLFGGLLRSSPKTGRTLSVLTFAGLCDETVCICVSKANLDKWRRQKNYLIAERTTHVHVCTAMAPEAAQSHILIADLTDASTQEINLMVKLPQRVRFVIPKGQNLHMHSRVLGVVPPKQVTRWTDLLALEFGRECIVHPQELEHHIVNVPGWEHVLTAQHLFVQSVRKCQVAHTVQAMRQHRLPSGKLVLDAEKQMVLKCFATPAGDTVCPVCSNEEVYVLTCGHHLCPSCASRDSLTKCPLCASTITLMALPRVLPVVDTTFYERVANFIHKHRLRKWLVIGGQDIACALVRKQMDVLFLPKASNRAVSNYTGDAVVVWEKHPDNVYLGAFTDIAFCEWNQTFYGSVHTKVRVHYFYLENSFNHHCQKHSVTKPKMCHLRDWAK